MNGLRVRDTRGGNGGMMKRLPCHELRGTNGIVGMALSGYRVVEGAISGRGAGMVERA